MNMLLLPLGVCKEMAQMLNSFWWDSKRNGGQFWTGCSGIACADQKMLEGQGFKRFTTSILLCSVSKSGNSSQPSSLVVQLYKSRYFPQTSLLQASLGSIPSYAWRSIWASQEVVWRNIRLQVGDGANIRVCHDPWLGDAEWGFITTNLVINYDNLRVQDLMQPGQQS